MLRLGINPSLNALGTLVMGFSILILILAYRFGGVKLGS
jgi:ABC-type spermidine/putrescine transport system permease subunit II